MMFACPVCGLKGLPDSPRDEFGEPSFEICPCCGIQFGYDDATVSHEELGRRWMADGMKWFSTCTSPPELWNPAEQYRRRHETR